MEDGVLTVVVGEGEFPVNSDGLEDVSTTELLKRKTLVAGFVVGVSLIRSGPRVVCIVAGPEPRVSSADSLEQHSPLV